MRIFYKLLFDKSKITELTFFSNLKKFLGFSFLFYSYACKILLFSFLLCLLIPEMSIAQIENLKFDRISIEQGLSQSAVYRIAQDKKGFMWFATQEGLNKFDGNSFVIFRNDRNDPNSLSSNNIWALLVDKTGALWVGTEGGGLNKFDSKSNKFTRFIHKPDDSNSLSDDNVRCIYEDLRGYIWMGTDRGLNRFNLQNNQFSHYYYDPNNPNSLANNQVYDILEDSKGNLWFATFGGGVCRYNESTNSFTRFLNDPDNPTSLIGNVVNCINEDHLGNIWIGTSEGLSRLTPENRAKMRFIHYTHDAKNRYSLSYNDVRHIYHDSQGALWIGTDGGGLNKFNYQNERFVNFVYDANDPNSLSEDRVQYIFEDRSGVLWIGTWSGGVNKVDRFKKKFYLYQHISDDHSSLSHNGVYSLYYDLQGTLWAGTVDGLNKFNQKNGTFTAYKSNPRNSNTLTSSRVWAIHEHPAESGKYLWVGTNKGLNHFDKTTGFVERYQHDPGDPASLSNDRIFAIYADSYGSLWIGTDGGGLNLLDRRTGQFTSSRFDPNDPTSISDDNITTIIESNNGDIWIGTRSSGLNEFNRETKQFTRYQNDPDNPNTLINNNIWAIHKGNQGDLWIGTEGGLSRLRKNKNGEVQFTHFTDQTVLPNNRTYGILEDDKENLWVSTNGGITKLNPNTMEYKNYDALDGLQSNEFNMAYSRNKDGLMSFGGINGLNIFHPDSIRDNPYIPSVVITDFQIFNKSAPIGEMTDGRTILNQSITETKVIELDYLDYVFSFEFAALHYVAPEKNHYSYIMEGFEENWNEVGNRHFITYTNLDGGEYVFRVRGSNSDGVWNTVGASIRLIVNPPFWETTWFITLVAIFLVASGYTGYRLRVKSITAQREMLKLEVAKKTQQLKLRNENLVQAKKETDNILKNVEEGLFLLDSDYKIESQYSESLKSILNDPDPSKKHIFKVLEDKVPKKIVTSIEEYIELMFRDEIEEGVINDLNPLSEVELNFETSGGIWVAAKHLSFKFKRILDDAGKTRELIATVKDITDQIQLALKLEESETQSKRQMEWLLSILHVEPNLLQEFIDGVRKEISSIDTILKSGVKDGNFLAILENIYRSMHLIKGNAGLLDLKFFASQAHDYEEKINEIKERSEITGSDFVPLSLKLGDMRRNLTEINSLIERISHIRTYFRPKRTYENQLLITSIENLIKNLSYDLKKEVQLKHENFNGELIPYQQRLLVKDILIQFVRNSIHHGFETSEERKKLKKPIPGTIEISTFSKDNVFGFEFKDNGRGMQISKLRNKIKTLGKWSEEEINKWDDKKIADTVFLHGVTTIEKADIISGRGVGMDLVKHKIKAYKGKIELDFAEGEYCKFVVTLPKKSGENKSIGENISS